MKKQFTLNGASYRLQDRFCNKEKCKCHDGHPHGPYWYAYSEAGPKYIGKKLPDSVLMQFESIERLTPKAHKKIEVINEKMRALRIKLSTLSDERRSIKVAIDGGYLNNAAKEYLASIKLGEMAEE